MPAKLADFLISENGAGENTDETIKSITRNIKKFCLPISSTAGIKSAQACSGGIDLASLTEELEAKSCKGLYFIGEAVDVDGTCGGYNLQWAWSSGATAGRSCAKEQET